MLMKVVFKLKKCFLNPIGVYITVMTFLSIKSIYIKKPLFFARSSMTMTRWDNEGFRTI